MYCSRRRENMRGTMLRYRASTNTHTRQITKLENPRSAKRETAVCAVAGVYVSRGIPSAELATERPFKMEFRLITTLINTIRAKSQSASLCPRYVLSKRWGKSLLKMLALRRGDASAVRSVITAVLIFVSPHEKWNTNCL